MRILLFTGKGGVGKTSVAAATALHAAARGARTVVCSTDPAHSLGDAFGVPLGDAPTRVAERLDAVQLDARHRFEAAWGSVRDYVVSLFDWAGADPVEAEELAVLPGLDELFALIDIGDLAADPDRDLVVVDCAPTAETLRLLSLPDVLGWYVERLFPVQRRVTRAVRPVVARFTNVPVAHDEVFAAVARFTERLAGVRALLTDGDVTSARLVVNPERVVVAEARRTATYLSLYGYHVDAVVANRILPDAIDDPWFARWRALHAEHLDEIRDAFAPLPVLRAELCPDELVGVDRLRAFGASLYGAEDPVDRLSEVEPFRVGPRAGAPPGDRTLVLSLRLPFVERREVDLARRDGELFVAVGPHRRAVVLPDSLARRQVGRARMTGDTLEVEFLEP